MHLFDLEDYATTFRENQFRHHFNPDGFYGGKNSWLSDDLTIKIIWDTTLNAWKLSGDSLGATQVINTNPNYPPINGDWKVLGQTYNVTANNGMCVAVDALSGVLTKNDPKCVCDGSITVTATGGVPPYQYSYDNGANYTNSPIQPGLCGGNYYVIIKDNLGTTVTKNIQLNQVIAKKTYTIELVLDSEVTTAVNTVESTYKIRITPALTPGVEINFDLTLASRFMRTPYINSASSTFTPKVIKGIYPLLGVDNTTQTEMANGSSGCQAYKLYFTNYSFSYLGLNIKSTDVFTITTIRQHTLTCNNTPPEQNAINGFGDELGPLSYGISSAYTYQKCCQAVFNPMASYVSNASLSGCDCCVLGDTYTKSLYE